MEGRVASDQDLKLVDTLRYYQRDSNAAKALLVRRLRCLAEYENANRNLEKARSKNKDVHAVSTIIKLNLIFHNRNQFCKPLEVQEVNFSHILDPDLLCTLS